MTLIPKIIHQTWKSNKIPRKWKLYVEKAKSLNPDWEYKLWTDSDNEDFVFQEFPELYKTYIGLAMNIMRADVIRYLIMFKIGGVYIDLDYEALHPFNFKQHSVVLPLNRSKDFGDERDSLGNCIMASIPQHKYWNDVIQHIQRNPPVVKDYTDVGSATGPMLLTKIYYNGSYNDIWTPKRILFHPPAPNNKSDYKSILNNGQSLGIHHGWGSWKERLTWVYLKNKMKQIG